MSIDQNKLIEYSKNPKYIFLKKKVVTSVKQIAKKQYGLISKSQSYLRLPKSYLEIALYCLTADKKQTLAIKQIFNKLGNENRIGFHDSFLIKNTERKSFQSPLQLQLLGERLNCNKKLIDDCKSEFKIQNINNYITDFKTTYKIPISYHGYKKDELGKDVKFKNNEPILALFIHEEDKSEIVYIIALSKLAQGEKCDFQKSPKEIQDCDISFSNDELPHELSSSGTKSLKNRKGRQSKSKIVDKQKQINQEEIIVEDETISLNYTFSLFGVILVAIIVVFVFKNGITSSSILMKKWID